MNELHKKIVSLLCTLALLLVVSAPAFGGGEHPWDSDNRTGGTSTGSDGSQTTDPNSGATQPLTGVYVGPEGILTGLGEWVYFYMSNLIDMGNLKSPSAAVRNGTTTQSKGF